jgi:hypothetical protein
VRRWILNYRNGGFGKGDLQIKDRKRSLSLKGMGIKDAK